ncbi:hypothetical protein ACFYWO_17845 [Streptomyces sp. NPDC002932]|uniref:hypothetical protein n=1 Tax=Streptomyces sp. NPDC002932 TaxID=3364672 RepID=UPI00368792CD
MSARPRPGANRAVLAVAGLALLLGGVLLAATWPGLGSRLPGWWPVARPDGVLLDRQGLADLRTRGWWTPAAVAGPAVLTLLLLWRCASRFRGGGSTSLELPSAGGAVRAGALAEALAQRTASLAGVSRCRVDITARRTRLHVRTHLWLDPDMPPAAVLGPLAALRDEAEESAAPYRIVGSVRIRSRARPAPHVR